MFGERLKLARKAAGLSLRELADRLDGLVTAQAIGKYERNEMLPSSRVLLALAARLSVTENYLLSSGAIKLSSVEFRRHRLASRRAEAELSAKVIDSVEKYLEIEEILAIESGWQPPPRFPHRIDEITEAEAAAGRLRTSWKLGADPFWGIADFLEDKGLKVIDLVLPPEVSGLLCGVRHRASEVHVIVINRTHPGERQRFTMAHELAHLVLRCCPGCDPERACNRFASAFLMPAESVIEETGGKRSSLSFGELFQLKSRFGVSIQAIAYRCHDLGIISRPVLASMFRAISVRGWRKAEPQALPPEPATRFKRLCFRAVAEGLISESRAGELLGVPAREVAIEMDCAPEAVPA